METEPYDLPPEEAAALIGVNKQTLVRWAREGKVEARKTPGGHRRFRRSDVLALLQPSSPEPTTAA